jgi:hypothetical protein
MLHTFTADTLKLGMMGHAGMNTLLMLAHPGTLTRTALAVEGVAVAAFLALPASQIAWARVDRERVLRDWRVSAMCVCVCVCVCV